MICGYIAKQKEHHRVKNFMQEYQEFNEFDVSKRVSLP
jgi:hypothetical protein